MTFLSFWEGKKVKPFRTNVPILYLLKTSENHFFVVPQKEGLKWGIKWEQWSEIG